MSLRGLEDSEPLSLQPWCEVLGSWQRSTAQASSQHRTGGCIADLITLICAALGELPQCRTRGWGGSVVEPATGNCRNATKHDVGSGPLKQRVGA